MLQSVGPDGDIDLPDLNKVDLHAATMDVLSADGFRINQCRL